MFAPSLASLPIQRVIVGVGEVSVSNHPVVVLSSYGLGSCLAVIAFDPQLSAGGLLHLMLPDSKVSPEKSQSQPAMFADTGLPQFFRALTGLGCSRARLRILLAGGASPLCQNDAYRIGERNVAVTREFLEQNGYDVRHSAVGGALTRTVHFQVGTGEVTLKSPTSSETVQLAG